MTSWFLWSAVAVADPSGILPTDLGFTSGPRTDAPTDGVILYGATYLATLTATDSAGLDTTLSTTYATGDQYQQVVAVTPPEGGWLPGETYTVTSTVDPVVVGPNPATLSFTVGAEPSDLPLAVSLDDVRIGEWTEGNDLGTIIESCCYTGRMVELDVTSADTDAWAWIDLVGRFDRSANIPATDPRAHLDYAYGPGSHTLSYLQWVDQDDVPQPPCVDIVPMSAGGIAGAPNQVCVAEDVHTDDTAPAVCGCAATTHSTGPWDVLLLLAVLTNTRHRRSHRTLWRPRPVDQS